MAATTSRSEVFFVGGPLDGGQADVSGVSAFPHFLLIAVGNATHRYRLRMRKTNGRLEVRYLHIGIVKGERS